MEVAIELAEARVAVAVSVALQVAVGVSVPVAELAGAAAFEIARGVEAVVTVWTGFPLPASASLIAGR